MRARPDPALIGIEAFTKLVGSTPREVAALITAGSIRRSAPGKVGLVQATRAYIEHVRMQARSATAAAAQAAAREARAEASELSVMVQNRIMVPDADADGALLHVCGAILECISGMAARVTRDRDDRSVIEAALCAEQAGLADDLVARMRVYDKK